MTDAYLWTIANLGTLFAIPMIAILILVALNDLIVHLIRTARAARVERDVRDAPWRP